MLWLINYAKLSLLSERPLSQQPIGLCPYTKARGAAAHYQAEWVKASHAPLTHPQTEKQR